MVRWLGAFVLSTLVVSLAQASVSDERSKKLPEKYRTWIEEEVTYIISDVEREAFLGLETEQEREAFINAFWRKRDSTPTTPENEYREEHYKRLAYVNEFYGRDTFRPGWMTDRGRFYIILGPPPEIQNFDGRDEVYPSELWFYNDPALTRMGLPPFFYLLFFRRFGSGELQLYSPISDGPQKLLTGYQTTASDPRIETERAYRELYRVSPELGQASLSFRTDEADLAQFSAPSFGTVALIEHVAAAPLRGVDTSYAEYFDIHKGLVESDYLFNFVPSWGATHVLPGPGESYYLHWMIEVDPQNISLVKDEERNMYGTVFIVSVEVAPRDDSDRTLVELQKESFVSFTEAQAATGTRMPFAYSGMMPVAPGSYDVRITLRNRVCPSRNESECRKSYTFLESSIDVPMWQTNEPRLSEIVLAYRAERPGDEPAYRPYRFGSVQILPNPRLTYAIGESAVAMTEALNAEPGTQMRFRIVSREDPSQARLEKSVDVGSFRLEPLVQELSLEGFTGDNYRLVVNLLDPEGRTIDTRTSDFDVSPRTSIARPSVQVFWPMILPEVPGLVELTIGKQYLNLGEKEKAQERFEAALVANPRMGSARESLASLLLETDETARVVELLEPIYQQVSDRYEVLILLGEAYFKQENYSGASELLEKAGALRQLDTRLLNFLAISQFQQGNRERARELLEQSLSLQPDQPDVKELLDKLKSEG